MTKRKPSIIGVNYNNATCILVHDDDAIAFQGQELTASDGTLYILDGGKPPHKPGSTGRIWVKDTRDTTREYFPSVLGLRWEVLP